MDDEYEDSLKYDRDMKNSLDFQYRKGRKEVALEIAQKLLNSDYDNNFIVNVTSLSIEQIEALRKEI